MRSARRRILPGLLLVLLGGAGPLRAATIVDPGQGSFALGAGAVGASELSGLTWSGGNQFYAVSDAGGRLFPLEIELDPATGFVVSATPATPLALADGVDLEGVAYDAATGTILVSDESGAAIREHSLSDGSLLGSVQVPAVFGQARSNLGLESLSLGFGALWTANEEALQGDGPVSSFSEGTWVRLQRFDPAGAATGQWAYRTDPIPGSPALGQERSGVADLLGLPEDGLLVLERSFSSAGFRTRIYEVDFTGASDVSALPGLDGAAFAPVGKSLHFEAAGLVENFEGMTLGPPLDDGTRSLLLVSDDGGFALQSLYALRIDPVPEPPGPFLACVGLLTAMRLARARRAERGAVS